MNRMRQFRGRSSPGCRAPISERDLAADLQGDLEAQAAFDGFVPYQAPLASAVVARPVVARQQHRRPTKGARGLVRGWINHVRSWFQR